MSYVQRAILAMLLTALVLVGCRKQPGGDQSAVKIVCSTFPVWLFTRNVTADVLDDGVTLLLPANLGCPHDYVVTPTDMQVLEKADVLVVNGLHLDDVIVEQYRRLRPSGRLIVASESIKDNGHHEADEDQAHEDHSAGADHDHALDEHASGSEAEAHQFASPRMAARMVQRIGAALAEIDQRNAQRYIRNADAYARRLTDLAEELRNAAADLPNRRIITQHSVFDLLARDVGLEIVGVIQAHAGHDPSAQEVMSLVTKARSARAAAVMTEPQYPPRLGRTIAQEAGIRVGVFDPVASGPKDAPLDYYETTMRSNMRALRETLGASASKD